VSNMSFESRERRIRVSADISSRAHTRQAQAKWAAGFAAAFMFGPVPILIGGVVVLFDWSLPLSTGLEFLLLCWVGPTTLLFWLAQWLDDDGKRLQSEAEAIKSTIYNVTITLSHRDFDRILQVVEDAALQEDRSRNKEGARELRGIYDLARRQVERSR